MKHPCQLCSRPATYQRKQVGRKCRGRIKANRQHDLCGRCFSKAMMSKQAMELREAVAA